MKSGNGGHRFSGGDSGRFLQPSVDVLTELIAEHIRVFQDPVNGCIHAQIFTGLFGLYPLMPLYFSALNLKI
jgi:hypothetical protein